ncbi:MAG: hypothetical protein WCC01_00985 [Acidimicrobiia bacterium]
MDPSKRGSHGSSRANVVAVGPYFGGIPMTFLTMGSKADDGYLERTADRLRTMAERTRALDGADPARVRERLEHMDRYARRNDALAHTSA